MKAYVKPALEVISMKTAENIADDSLIKTIYTQLSGQTGYSILSNDDIGVAYDESADMGATLS